MGESEQNGAKKLLTGREREFVQELAKAIVREAGLARNPAEKRLEDVIDTYRERRKSVFDFSKQMMTLSSASIVAVVTVSGVFLSDTAFRWPIYVSLGLLSLSLLMNVMTFHFSIRSIQGVPGDWEWRTLPEEELRERAELLTHRWARAVTAVLYPWFFGLLIFAWGFFSEVV
jgi:hypothetical protein